MQPPVQHQPWHGIPGTTIMPPGPPELLAGDEAGFSLAVRWPSVPTANAYVVELREVGSMHVERFVRSAVPGAPPGSLVELRVGGLRPSPGRIYTAQLRCVDHNGCESVPSAPGTAALPPYESMPPLPGTAPLMMPPMHAPSGACMSFPPPQSACMPPPPQWAAPEMTTVPQHNASVQMPAGFAYANGGNSWPYSSPLPDASPLSVHIAPSPAADGYQPGAPEAALAAAIKEAAADPATNPLMTAPTLQHQAEIPLAPLPGATSGAPLVPPPSGPPGAVNGTRKDSSEKLAVVQKDIPPEVTGQEECLILD